jgi:hypothetical protein
MNVPLSVGQAISVSYKTAGNGEICQIITHAHSNTSKHFNVITPVTDGRLCNWLLAFSNSFGEIVS